MGGSTTKQVQDTQQHVDAQQDQTTQQLLQSLQSMFQQNNTSQNQQTQATSSGQQTGTQQQTGVNTGSTTQSLAPGQQPNVDLLLAGARDNYQAGATDPLQQQARAQAQQYATGSGQNLVNTAQNADLGLLDPNRIYDVANNQQFNTMADTLTQRANKNLFESILPQVRSSAIMNNNFGGSAQGLNEGRAIGDTTTGLADSLAGLASNVSQQNASLYNAAQGRVGTNYNLGLAPSSTLDTIGAAGRNDQNAALQMLQSLTGGAGTYGGTTTQTGTQQQTGTTEQANTGVSNQSSQSNIESILRSLGLTDTSGTSDTSGNSTTDSTGHTTDTVKKSGGPLSALGSIISILAAIPTGGASLIPALAGGTTLTGATAAMA